MLDTQNQGPQCTACGSPMKLAAIEPSSAGHDLRTFACPKCRRVQRHVIESTVTEAWPQRVNLRHAVTHDITDGRMVPKRAK
jgi:tRNA(Ile2) C34 agmatinyltransferase TiaS